MSGVRVATGHRPDKLGGYSLAARLKLEAFAEAVLRSTEPDRAIIGMAQGWDQAVGVACRRLGIPYDAYIPFIGQEAIWPSEAKSRYIALLAKARTVEVVSAGDYAPWKMQARNVAMLEAGDSVLALWDGSPGGTANCIRAAGKKFVLNVWSRWTGTE
jgi:uncharacterized phage-like protein YoqJ